MKELALILAILMLCTSLFASCNGTQEDTGESPDTTEATEETYSSAFDAEGNYTPMLYNKLKYDLIEAGFFLFDKTPDDTKGITWAVLEDKASGLKVGMCNIHYWVGNGPERGLSRLTSASQNFERITYIAEKYNVAVFTFGDFNCSATDSETFDYFGRKDVRYIWNIAEEKDENPPRVDHIVSYNFEGTVKTYHGVWPDYMDGATDHKPVYADIIVTGAGR